MLPAPLQLHKLHRQGRHRKKHGVLEMHVVRVCSHISSVIFRVGCCAARSLPSWLPRRCVAAGLASCLLMRAWLTWDCCTCQLWVLWDLS